MRKMYFMFSLALLFLGVNVASAKIVLGEQNTAPKVGDVVMFQTHIWSNSETEFKFNSWAYAKAGDNKSWTLNHGGKEDASDANANYLFELVDANTSMTYGGKTYQGYLLFNKGINKYVARNGSSCNFKNNIARAQVFYLVPPAEFGVMRGREPGNFESSFKPEMVEALKSCFDLVVRTKADGDGNGKDGYDYSALWRYNNPFGFSSYDDWAVWMRVFNASDVVDEAGLLADLVSEVEPVVNQGVVGTLPGYVANEAAFNELKAAYATATAADADASTAYPLLKEAYDKFCEDGYKGHVALTDGFYYIRSAHDAFYERDGIYRAMYANPSDNGLYWNAEDQDNKSYMWKVTATDNPDRFVIQNVATLGYLNGTSTNSEHQKTTTDSIDCRVTTAWGGTPKFTLGNGKDFHAANSGGNSSTVVAWDAGTPGTGNTASTWAFIPIENHTAEELQGSMEQLVRNDEYADLLSTAMNLYRSALSFQPYSRQENNIITYTPAEGEDATKVEYGEAGTWAGGTITTTTKQGSEGSYGALCDGVNVQGSFFHSAWGGSVSQWHYLQFDLKEPIKNVAFYWAPRLGEGVPRRLSKIDIQVCNDTTGGGVWTTVASMNTDYAMTGDEIEINGKPVAGNDEVLTGAASLLSSYKHIRMVAKEVMSRTVDKETGLPVYTANAGKLNGYPFFTAGELNILKVEEDPNCQMAALKQNADIAPVIAALEAQFTKAVDIVNPSAQDMLDLQKAYDDFVAVFPDPAPLTKLIEDTQKYMANMYVGGVPGTYETQGALDEKLLVVTTAIENAQADIDDQILYTKQQVENHIAAIEAAKQELIDGARPIDFTKWVRLYITREYWAKNPDLALPSDWVLNSAMYAPETAESEIGEIPFDVFNQGIAQSFDWRFIPVTGGYIIQSRSTGKFIGESRSYESSHSWYPALSSIPAVFTVEPIGGGSFVIAGANLDGSGVTEKAGYGAAFKYLHGAVAGQALAYWESRNLGSRSGWEFEIQNDDAFTEDANADMQNAFTAKNLVANKLYTGCYPTEITLIPEEGGQLNVYTVAGKDADESVIYLRKMEDMDGGYTIPAGTPFLYEMGEEGSDFTQYVETEGEEASYVVDIYYEVYPTLNAEENDALFVTAPEKTAGVVGLFSDERVYKGHGLVSVYEKSNAVVPYFLNEIEEDDEITRTVLHRAEAYIDPASATVLSADEAADCKELPIAGKVDNAIDQVAGADTEGTFDVYTIDGIRVRTGVNKANALKGLKSGLYIINKQKVVVK